MRKGQVTLFVILGLLLFFIVFLFLFLFNRDVPVYFDDPVYLYPQELSRDNWVEEVQYLSFDEAEEVIELVSELEREVQEEIVFLSFQTSLFTLLNQGGVLSDFDNLRGTSFGPVVVVSNKGGEVKPSIGDIERELEHVACNVIEQDLRSNYLDYEAFLSVVNVDCSVIVSNYVLVNVNVVLLHELFDFPVSVFNSVIFDVDFETLVNSRDYIVNDFDLSNPGGLDLEGDFSVSFLDADFLMVNLLYEFEDEFRVFPFVFEYGGAS